MYVFLIANQGQIKKTRESLATLHTITYFQFTHLELEAAVATSFPLLQIRSRVMSKSQVYNVIVQNPGSTKQLRTVSIRKLVPFFSTK